MRVSPTGSDSRHRDSTGMFHHWRISQAGCGLSGHFCFLHQFDSILLVSMGGGSPQQWDGGLNGSERSVRRGPACHFSGVAVFGVPIDFARRSFRFTRRHRKLISIGTDTPHCGEFHLPVISRSQMARHRVPVDRIDRRTRRRNQSLRSRHSSCPRHPTGFECFVLCYLRLGGIPGLGEMAEIAARRRSDHTTKSR